MSIEIAEVKKKSLPLQKERDPKSLAPTRKTKTKTKETL